MFEKYSAKSLSRKKPLSLRFAFSSVPHIIATFFGSGVLRPASGTWGTLAGLVFYLIFENFIPLSGWIALIVVSFFLGAWASHITGEEIGVHDHSSLVIDEVFAIWLVLIAVPPSFCWQCAAFVAFRFFDIVKIQPAKYFDTSSRWHNGWGVMLDDLVAAIQAIIVLVVVQKIFFESVTLF